jgi:hypothetical protein
MIPDSSTNLSEFFEDTKKAFRTEGAVIYPWDYKVQGNAHGTVKNRSFYKCKFRDGDDGRTIIA